MSAEEPARRIPISRKILFTGVVLLGAFVFIELLLRLYYGSTETYSRYRWIVDTHLIDLSYKDFLDREARIKAVRARLGMERGRSHPIFGWTYNPTFRIDEADVEVHINSLALRGEEFPEKKPQGEIRIICLGGSTTAGEEVREAETYPAQLQVLLRERCPTHAIRVINAGIPTYDVRTSLLHYELILSRFEPDFVTIYHGVNDLYTHRGGGARILPKQNYNGAEISPFVFEGDAQRSIFREFSRTLLSKSQLLTLIYHGWKYNVTAAGGSLQAPDEDGIDGFAAFYRALVRHIASSGAGAVPMTCAISYPGNFSAADRKRVEASFGIWLRPSGISLDVGKQIVDRMNQAIADVSRGEGLPLCDVASAVPPDREHFLDVCHLTAQGNRSIAEELAATLVPLIQRRAELAGPRSAAPAGR